MTTTDKILDSSFMKLSPVGLINGIGAKATNALSEYFDVCSYRYDGTCKHVLFKKGVLKKEEII